MRKLLPRRACFDSSNRDVHPSQNILRFFVKGFPCRSQGNGVLAANDKCDSNFFFQALYLAAQGRLRQVQLVCRPAKTSMCGHGGKISQMTKFHTHSLGITKSMSHTKNTALAILSFFVNSSHR